MGSKGVFILSALIFGVAAALSVAGSRAEPGGCPNDAAANGATHANDRSAHGAAKQADRGCVVTPTPTPTPSPTPSPQPTSTPTPTPTPTPSPTLPCPAGPAPSGGCLPCPTPEPLVFAGNAFALSTCPPIPPTPTGTGLPTPTPTPTPTPPGPTPTPTPSPTPCVNQTPIVPPPSPPLSATPTPSPRPCPTPSGEPTPTPTPTPTAEPTSTAAPVVTPTPTPTAQPTPGPIVDFVAIDVDPTGNTATSLGAVDTCVAVSPGSTFTVDIVVDAIPPFNQITGGGLLAFQYDFNYGSLHVTGADNEQLIAANGVGALDFTEALPDNDGTLVVAFADFGTDTPESGAGILTRLTLQAGPAGTVDLTLADLGLVDSLSNLHPVSTVGSARVEVGGSCGP